MNQEDVPMRSDSALTIPFKLTLHLTDQYVVVTKDLKKFNYFNDGQPNLYVDPRSITES